MSELKAFESERIYWAVEQVEREASDIDDLHLDDNLFYLKSNVDQVIADLEESHKREVEQLLMKIAGLEKLVETADKIYAWSISPMLLSVEEAPLAMEGPVTHCECPEENKVTENRREGCLE